MEFPSISEAGGSGDMGDIDNDGCDDWGLGPNDDGNDGAVHAMYGDCTGNLRSQSTWVDNCSDPNCYGDGTARLADWDFDGDMDLMSTYNEIYGGPYTLVIYENLGLGKLGPASTVAGGWTASSYATPLRIP